MNLKNQIQLEIQKYAFSRIGAKLWNEIPTNIRNFPKDKFKKRIRAFLFEILESVITRITVKKRSYAR